jgi:hypothetical protein
MKQPLLHSLLVACFWFGLSTAPHAQTGTPKYDPLGEFDDLPKQIRVQVEFIDVSHEQLRKQVAQLVKDGKASIVETMLCIARSGQKAQAASIEEAIYPTEYEPASMPAKVEFKNKKEAEAAKVAPRDLATGPAPTAWETRNVGPTLEIEPTLSEDNKTIDLRFAPEIVYHVGNTVWAEWKDQYGKTLVQMPKFYTVRINTAVTLAAGQYLMVAAVSPKNQDGATDFSRKLMIFVKADVLSVGR